MILQTMHANVGSKPLVTPYAEPTLMQFSEQVASCSNLSAIAHFEGKEYDVSGCSGISIWKDSHFSSMNHEICYALSQVWSSDVEKGTH